MHRGMLPCIVLLSCFNRQALGAESRLSAPAIREQVVREIYSEVAQRLVPSGQGANIGVDRFQHIEQARFDELPWSSAVELAQGDVVNLSRRGHTSRIQGRRWAEYDARWALAPSLDLASQRFAALPIAATLKEARRFNEGLQEIASITSYRVTLTLGDRTISYRAAILWHQAGDVASALVADTHLVGIDQVLEDDVPVSGLPLVSEGDDFGLAPEADAGVFCDTQQWLLPFDKNPTAGRENHYLLPFPGFHKARLKGTTTCSCDHTCASRCVVSTEIAQCWEAGGVTSDGQHLVASKYDDSDGFKPDGRTGGAACTTAFACAVKACVFGLCGVSVNVVVNGTTIQWTVPTDALKTYTLTPGSVVCPSCAQLPPPPPTIPPPPTPGAIWLGTIPYDIDHSTSTLSGIFGVALPGPNCSFVCLQLSGENGRYYQSCFLSCS